MLNRQRHFLVLFLACLGATSAWSASFPSHHQPLRTAACPVAVENLGKVEQVGHPDLKNANKKADPPSEASKKNKVNTKLGKIDPPNPDKAAVGAASAAKN